MAFFAGIIQALVKMAIVVVFAGVGIFAGKKLRDNKNSKAKTE